MKRNVLSAIITIIILFICQTVTATFPICTDSANQSNPSISGNIVVWQDDRNGNGDIYGYNLTTQTEFPICIDNAEQSEPAISGQIVVWYNQESIFDTGDIYGYDLTTQTKFPICTNPSSQYHPSISGNIVVWQDFRNGDYDIYGYDLSTETEFPICTESDDQYTPAISGNIIVWQDRRDRTPFGWDIYGYDLNTKIEIPICAARLKNQYLPDVSGDIVVWQDERNSTPSIYGYDLNSQTEFLVNSTFHIQKAPAISGNTIVWEFHFTSPSTSDIYCHNLSTQKLQYPICSQSDAQYSVAISGNNVVWEDYRNGNSDIYGLSIDWERVVVSSDTCASAFEVFEDVPFYGATYLTSGTDISSCSFNDIYDAWNSYTPTQGGTVTISTDGSNFDTVLSVYEACGGNELACNDDYSIDNTQSKIVRDVVKGKNYLIRIAGFNQQDGECNLLITRNGCTNKPQTDVNDDCKTDILDLLIMTAEWLDCGWSEQDGCL